MDVGLALCVIAAYAFGSQLYVYVGTKNTNPLNVTHVPAYYAKQNAISLADKKMRDAVDRKKRYVDNSSFPPKMNISFGPK